ncbi:membrane protein [Capnocytophaga catalasegens]|uniref:Membrane protein n=2 Tax=Capnocytophaga catalasegens TaxID=1004260 RepID=A0AAV5ATU0_9FLAO|nr:membrane protein [Capnocytophaga catalasegens]GJM49276.1 membrane protein [Capnocytophaga catalasegens]GJM52427.1 membrane protein [Capnocytophaga catalasegens]
MVAVALMLGATTVSMAQSKVAHIDSQKLLSEMPEMKSAQAQLQKLEQTYTNDIQSSVKEYTTKAQAFQNEVNALTEDQLKSRQAELERKSKELETMQNNIRQAQQTAAEDLQKKQQSLLAPLYEKARKAVEKVAKAQGFDYVLDSTQPGTVIFANGKDLYNDVKKELGF